MLIGLVRDSVLQCFCHSCKAPLTFIATEIRCQEKTKGGLRYEVILAEPTVQRPPSPQQNNSPQPTKIEEKLKAAEERRQMLELDKLKALSAKMSKIEEAARKKDELNMQFIESTRKSLDAKMNTSGENRDAHIADIKTKLKEHLESVEKTRLVLEEQTEEIRCALYEKLKTAAMQRDENIKKLQERLNDHDRYVELVRERSKNKSFTGSSDETSITDKTAESN